MNAVNEMPFMVTGMEVSFTPKTQSQTASGTEPNKFESVLREKHQEAADQAGGKKKLDSSKPNSEREADAPEQDVTEEQYTLAAAMMMQPRPEIIMIQPEQTAEQPVLTEAVPDAADQMQTVEILPEAAQSALTASNEPAQAKAEIPMEQVTVESKTSAEQGEQIETFQPIEGRDASAEPQKREETGVKLENSAEAHRTERSEEEPEEDFELEGAWSEPLFGQTDAMPVKVAAPEKPVDLEAPDAAEQLTETLTDAVEQGLEHVQIRLTPEGLGELNITITRTESGALSVILRAADPKALNLLQQHTTDLHNTMANAMRSEVQIEVHETQNSQQQQLLNPDGQQEHGQQRQQPQQQREKQESNDFMQKLRLGLTELTQTV